MTAAPDPARDRAARAAQLVEIAEHIRDAIRHDHEYQSRLDREVILDLGESCRQLRAVAAELAKPEPSAQGLPKRAQNLAKSPDPAEAMAGELTDLATRIVARAREVGGLGRGLDDSYMRGVGMIEAAEIVLARARALVEGEAGR